MSLVWKCPFFTDLTVNELYDLLRLRSEVFVVEQNCIFLDADNIDKLCHHLLGFNEHKELVASVRIVPPGITYEYMSIGRVVSSPKYRGKGFGKQLMEKAIDTCEQLYGQKAIKIGAQCYLQRFYESFGFKQCGEVYMEDGIPHMPMIKN
ncbi:MAG: GNAT family N-acetyltransferase [Chitinophagaceae bacterium]